MRKAILLFVWTIMVLIVNTINTYAQNYWINSEIDTATTPLHAVEYEHLPTNFRLLEFDITALRDTIINTPNQCIDIPMPDGSIECFNLTAYTIAPDDLIAKRPDILTFRGKSTQAPTRRLNMVLTANDIHIIGDSDQGTFFIDKLQGASRDVFMSFYTKNEIIPPMSCQTPNHNHNNSTLPSKSNFIKSIRTNTPRNKAKNQTSTPNNNLQKSREF